MSRALDITSADPRSDDGRALLGASHALMHSLYPDAAIFALSVDALCAPHIRFFIAWHQDEALGCVALAQKDGYGEVKSLFVAPEARGSGAGAALMAHLERAARAAGLPDIYLETGDTLDVAHRLYASCGYRICSPFGDYAEGPYSVFMHKALG